MKKKRLSKPEREARNSEMRMEWTTNPNHTYASISQKYNLSRGRAFELLNGQIKAPPESKDQTKAPNKPEQVTHIILKQRRERLQVLQLDTAISAQKRTQKYIDKLEIQMPWFESRLKQFKEIIGTKDPVKGNPQKVSDYNIRYQHLLDALHELKGLMGQAQNMLVQASKASERTQVLVNEGEITVNSGPSRVEMLEALKRLDSGDKCILCGREKYIDIGKVVK